MCIQGLAPKSTGREALSRPRLDGNVCRPAPRSPLQPDRREAEGGGGRRTWRQRQQTGHLQTMQNMVRLSLRCSGHLEGSARAGEAFEEWEEEEAAAEAGLARAGGRRACLARGPLGGWNLAWQAWQ